MLSPNPADALTAPSTYYPLSSYEVSVGGLTTHWSKMLRKWMVTDDTGTALASGSASEGEDIEKVARQALMDELTKRQS